MLTKAGTVLLVGMSAVLMFTAPPASADEIATDGTTLALPDRPADDGVLGQQSASSPATVVDTTGIQPPNISTPTNMTATMPSGGTVSIGSTSSSATISSTLSATITSNDF